MSKYKIIRNVLSEKEKQGLLRSAETAKYRPCPEWLGNFDFKVIDLKNIEESDVPKGLLKIASKLAGLLDTDQQFNTIFLQRYKEGSRVKPHIDPRNNKGHTIIAVFGDFEGGISTIDGKEEKLNAGDVIIQQCTIGYGLGPRHSVSEITKGTRYALILNTIIKEIIA